mgnify:CR=1 FL=1
MMKLILYFSILMLLLPIALAEKQPGRKLYLGVEKRAFEQVFSQGIGRIVREQIQMEIMVFDKDREEVIQWTTEPT